MLKKTLRLVVVTFMVACFFIAYEKADASESLADINGHWAEENIRTAVEKGYVNGYPNGNFGPNDTLTRAEFFKMVTLALGIEVSSTDTPWYKPYVDAAIANKLYVVGDFSSTDYNKPLTREEMSKVAVRGLNLAEDVDAKEWMYIAAGKGIINGTAIGEISPEGTSTRAQAVVVIQRLLDAKNGVELPIDKYAVSAAELYWHRTNIITMIPAMFKDYEENEGGIGEYDPNLNISQSKDGKVYCEIKELIVVDLDDSKDPNLKILKSDSYVVNMGFDGTERRYPDLFTIKDAYALFSVSETVIYEKPSQGYRLTPCFMHLMNDTWGEVYHDIDPDLILPGHRNFGKKSIYGHDQNIIYYEDFNSFPTEPIIDIRGLVLPKNSELKPHGKTELIFYQLFDFGLRDKLVYRSFYNEDYPM